MAERGRPRKPESEKRDWRNMTIYLPMDVKYNAVWIEFDRLCRAQKDPIIYKKDERAQKGIIIRTLIMNFVLQNTTKQIIKDTIKELITKENQARIKAWERDTGETYVTDEPTIEETQSEEAQDV